MHRGKKKFAMEGEEERKSEDGRKFIRRSGGRKGGKRRRGVGGPVGASLDRGLVRKTGGKKTVRLACPSVRQIGKEFRASRRLHLEACGAMEAQDKSTRLTVCLHKTQIHHRLQKKQKKNTASFPGAYDQGFAPLGCAGLVCGSIAKTAFQRV